MLEPHLSGKMLFMFLLLAKRTMQLPLCICADFVWPLRDTANSLFLRKKKKEKRLNFIPFPITAPIIDVLF